MKTPKIKSTAVLVGYNPEGQCVYRNPEHDRSIRFLG
jgi:hypothetical protein